ncbi:MAG TPA: Sec-independent protein translocase protein TatB [Gammaproteobacteria bacterium]|jgi:sec-independent protein translocase protein TatB
MFDIGFWELVVIAVIALLVVGPERLPELVRETGRWVRAARRFVTDTRYQIEREFELDARGDFKQNIADLDRLMRSAPDREPPRAADPADRDPPASR